MLLIAAFIAGLFLVLKDGIPWLNAIHSGVIRTRKTRSEKVVRSESPDRFKALLDQRLKGMIPGLLCLGGAIAWSILTLVGAGATAAQT